MHFFFYNELKVYIKGELKYLEEVHLGIGANKNYVLLTDPFLFFINEKCVRTYFDSIGKILLKKKRLGSFRNNLFRDGTTCQFLLRQTIKWAF